LLIACIGGGVALCLAVALGAFFLFHDSKKSTTEVAVNPAPFVPPPTGFEPPPTIVKQNKPAPKPEEPALPSFMTGQANGNDVYRHVLKSVAWIIVPQSANMVAMGTGTLVDRTNRLVLTNNHVIRGGNSILVFFPNFREGGQPIAERDNYLKHVERKDVNRAIVVATDVLRDLALIQLEQIPDGVEALAVGRQSANVGQTVHSVGNPGASGALWVYTSGTVRQVYEKTWRTGSEPREGGSQGGPGSVMRPPINPGPPGRRLGAPQPGVQQPGAAGGGPGSDTEEGTQHRARVVETQSPTNPGDSGGPLVNDHGELVGVTQGGLGGAQLVSLFVDVTEAASFIEGYCRGNNVTWERETRSLRLGSNPSDLAVLIKAIENPDDNIRAKAVQALGNVGAEAKLGIPPLLKLVREESTKEVTRKLALEALNKIGPPDRNDTEIVRECLKDHEPKIRCYGAVAMGKLGPDAASALTDLVRLAKDSNVEVRQKVTLALGKMGTDSKDTVFPILTEALKDSHRDVRVAAAQSLAGMESLGATDVPMLMGLLKHQDSEARISAAHALGHLGDKAKAAVPGLIKAFESSDPALRSASIDALAKLGSNAKDVVPAFTQALSESDKEVRKNACEGLGKVGPDAKPAVSGLARLLTDSDKEVKKNAAIALGKIGAGAKDAVVTLGDVLNKDLTIRVEILTALGEIGPAAKAAVPNIVAIFAGVDGKTADKAMHLRAAQTLGKIGKDAVPDLVNALGNTNNLVRIGAAEGLGEIGPPAKKLASRALAAHAQLDPDPQVRVVAGLAYSKVLAK